MSQLFVSAVAVAAMLHGCEMTTDGFATSTSATADHASTISTSSDSTSTASTADTSAIWSTTETTTSAQAASTTSAQATSTSTKATTSVAPAKLLCTESEEACAADLNKLYLGFDESDDTSPLGVPIRGRPVFDKDGQWYYCTGECFRGQPDCYVAAGLMNHKIMTTEDGKLPNRQNSKSGRDAFFARYTVLIVLQPQTTLTRFTKCAWQFDGNAFNRQNGGCGFGAFQNGCDALESAFNDRCHDNTSRWADESCATTMRAYCGNASVGYETNCFWKGPAFSSPVHPGAEPDFDFSSFADNDEIRVMMKNRVSGEHQRGTTAGGLPLREYWNELTMDGRILKHFEQMHGFRSVVAAVAFARGNGEALDAQSQRAAQQFQDHFKQHGSEVPLLVLDTESEGGAGPFKLLSSDLITV